MQLSVSRWGRTPGERAATRAAREGRGGSGDLQSGRAERCLSVLLQRETLATCAAARDTKKQRRSSDAVSTQLLRGQLPTRGLGSLRLSKRGGPGPARCRLAGLSGHLAGAQFPSCPSGQTHGYGETQMTVRRAQSALGGGKDGVEGIFNKHSFN